MKVQMVIHYAEEDSECGGEYYEVDILVDGKKAVTYGDHYHEKGWERAEGFIGGVMFRHKKNVEVLPLLQIADM